MTSEEFRTLALSLPGASEDSHMGHPDFRMNGKIFATLRYPDEQWGMVKLTPEQQNNFAQAHPHAFTPVKGGWGRQGCTSVRLEAVDKATVLEALRIASAGTVKTRKRAFANSPAPGTPIGGAG